ncbi:hypothetical protein F2Q69_00030234 [Brassica cretica]|uniref:Arabidopsis retrotransposon Orf1 C-terminal domain-containing protein n=1 Tax=Brassica cretica TaxID=69181 RepID=A0A8S9S318_BRACR|nr:hypothetical protein F2Q69_00030234 [Brassica cretica]
MDRASIDAMPTRFGHAETLAALGIDTDVFDIIQAMGIALLCYQTHELYPDLVRQFWSLSLDKLNEIYEIVDETKEVAVEKNFAPSNAFWDLISNCRFTSRKAYQSQIRNPTLRVIAKMVSNLLFAKDQTSKMFYTRREWLMRTENKKDRCGSLLFLCSDTLGSASNHMPSTPRSNPPNNLQHVREHRFLPDPEFLCIDPRAPPTDADMDDVEDITPDAAAAYD